MKNLDRLACSGELEEDPHRLQAGQAGPAFVDDHPVWHAVGGNRTTQEPVRCQ